MLRAGRSGAKVGDTVYLIANQWFYKWRKITGYDVRMFLCMYIVNVLFVYIRMCVFVCLCVRMYVCLYVCMYGCL